MTKLKLLSAGLIAAGLLAAPAAMAREGHVTWRHLSAGPYAGAVPGARYVDGRLCYPAPRVGAFATQPWDHDVPCLPAPVY